MGFLYLNTLENKHLIWQIFYGAKNYCETELCGAENIVKQNYVICKSLCDCKI